LTDNCGLFGVFGESDCAELILAGLNALQHRGQRYCGLATVDRQDFNLVTHRGPAAQRVSPAELASLTGSAGIGYVGRMERQPIKHRSKFGQMAVCFTGHLQNASEVLAGMLSEGRSFSEGTQAEVLSKLIGTRSDVAAGLERVFTEVQGAYSLLVLTRDALYAARDPMGVRPLTLGWGEGRWVVASESRALHGLDLMVKRDIRPGEVIRIDAEGVAVANHAPGPRTAHCAFEWAYIAAQDSVIQGVWVRDARRRMGEALAARDRHAGLDADVVAPVPRSGIGSALGYHAASGLPYEEVFLDLRGSDWHRSMPEDQKWTSPSLSVVRPAVQGKRIVLCDDSIVRGNQIQRRLAELRAAGAAEVHVRVACPPLMFSCDYGVATRSPKEYLARHLIPSGRRTQSSELDALGDSVARVVGADSVRYNTLTDFVSALDIDAEQLCLCCFDGHIPWHKKPDQGS
jgi:amidophosphoribosyltransferase